MGKDENNVKEHIVIDLNSATATVDTCRMALKKLLFFGNSYGYFDQEKVQRAYDDFDLTED